MTTTSPTTRNTIDRFAVWFSWGCLAMLLLQPVTAGYVPPAEAFYSSRHLLLPLLFPLGLRALYRRRFAAIPALVGCVVWLMLMASWQQAARPVEGEPDIRFVTLNLGDTRSGPESVGDALEGLDADVVALQEVGDHHVPELRARFADRYPHQAWYPQGRSGKALLSRVPITRDEVVVFSDGARVLDALLDVDGREVRVFNVHLRPWVGLIGRAASGAREFETLTAQSEGCTLIAGDFNSLPGSGILNALESLGFANAFDEVGGGAGFTFPVANRYWRWPGGPMYAIDHVLHSHDVTALNAMVAPDAGSDHLPVVVEVKFVD